MSCRIACFIPALFFMAVVNAIHPSIAEELLEMFWELNQEVE